jgi:hypothetical protein
MGITMKKVKRSKRHMTRGDINMVNEEVSKNIDIDEVSERTKRNNKLRSDSGNIEFEDTLTSFFYYLMRDHMPAGEVEKIVRDVACESGVSVYSNGFLAQYANNLANFLKDAKTNALAKALDAAFTGTPKPRTLKSSGGVNSLGNDMETLQELKEKVDLALENMTEDEKREWDERLDRIDEKIKEEDSEWVEKQITKANDDLDLKEKDKKWIEEKVKQAQANLREKQECGEESVSQIKEDIEKVAHLGTVDAKDNTMVAMSQGTFDRPDGVSLVNGEDRQEWLKQNVVEVDDNTPSRDIVFDLKSKARKSKIISDIKEKTNSPDRQEWLKQNVKLQQNGCGGNCKCEDDVGFSCASEKAQESLDNHKELQYKADLSNALAGLDKLKKLVPTDSVEQIVKILKSEVEEELTDEAKEEMQTRESILEERAKENAEHKSPEPDAEEKAVEFIKEQVAEQIAKNIMEDVADENEQASRGKLSDVAGGRAFPEALDKVFDDDNPEEAMERVERVKEQMEQLRAEDGVKTAFFSRVE